MRLAGLISTLTAIVVLTGALAGWAGWRSYRAPGPLPVHKIVVINRGEGLKTIADGLAAAHVIGDATLFTIAARLSGQAKGLNAGEYDFPAHIAMTTVMTMMANGEVVLHKITIPEGLTSWQAVQIIDRTAGLTGTIATLPPEGSLLPQTYAYQRGDTRQSIVARMQAAMTKTLDTLWQARDKTVAIEKDQVVTLASIVEKETGLRAEQRRVAGVFYNRLRIHMPLQADSTVIYALTQGHVQQNGEGPLGRRMTTGDLKIPSPYNTYLHTGLPPGPIANPGTAAIAAVLTPEHNDYLYFVADGTGGHVFAKTLKNHNRNVARWHKIRDQ